MIIHRVFYSSCFVFMAVCMSATTYALEELSDTHLAKATAQDGISIGVQTEGKIGLEKVRFIQNDVDFTLNGVQYNQSGGISMNMTAGKIMFCAGETASSNCTTNSVPMKINVDVDGGNGTNNAVLNANIKTFAKSIYVPIKNISLLGGKTTNPSANIRTSWSKEVPIISFDDGVKINGKSGISANIQLGSQPQGSMILVQLADGDTTSIDMGNIKLLSQALNTADDSQISTNVSVNGFNSDIGTFKATGMAIDIDSTSGLEITKERATVENISINNTVLGEAGVADANTFNGLNNASIGNISIDNIKINNLKIGVAGL